MSRLRLCPRWWAAALLACSPFILPQAVNAQTPLGPLEARLFVCQSITDKKCNPPFEGKFASGTPIIVDLQVRNVNGIFKAPVGTSSRDHWRFVVFTSAAGDTVTNRVPHIHRRVVHCLSQTQVVAGQQQVVLLPRPIPGFLVETVLSGFFREDIVEDARQANTYNLTRPGRWTGKALFPLEVVQGDGTKCDQFPGQILMSLGADRQAFPVESNTVEFVIPGTFPGFLPPLNNPDKTFKFGNAVDVKFQWLDGNGNPVKDAVANIAVAQGGQLLDPSVDLARGGSNPTNQFRFDPNGKQYVFQLDTKVLPTTGRWDIIVTIEDDGSVHTTSIFVQ